ncbi:ATP-binding protein [Actinoplanes sp. NPDC051494]|uniref:ATP-binding protein n=1 Tax=Actinoplanes sp. NPDC051494 TaxID=3363907 RepID=UPI0037A64315
MHLSMTLSLPRQPSSVSGARRVLTTLMSLTEAGEETRDHLAVLISEACANAVRHAEPDSTVDISIDLDDHDCVLQVGNRGTSPDGAGLRAALPAPLTIGGRGLPLITALADTATFVPGPPGQVLLRMTKRL